MECTDFMVLVCSCFLLMACGNTSVFAQKRQELNGRCIHVDECSRIGYFCGSNRTCQCASGYKPNERWTKCVGFVGSRCIYDNHCIEGAYCTGTEGRETCRCRQQDGFLLSDDSWSCISLAWTLHQKPSTVLGLLSILWSTLYLNT